MFNAHQAPLFFGVLQNHYSLPDYLLSSPPHPTLTSIRWQIFFADERLVPLDHDDSNFKECWGAFFETVGVPRANIHTIDADLEVEAAGKAYACTLLLLGGAVFLGHSLRC